MSNAERYRAFARECMQRAERARSIGRREALLDTAMTWGEAAARVDHQYALIDEFHDTVCEAKYALRTATDGSGLIMQANGSDPTEHTNDHCEAKQQSGERGDASAE